MRVGVDVRNLTSVHTGIQRVVLQTLLALDRRGVKLILYWPGETKALADFSETKAEHRVSFFRGSLGRHFWGLLLLPRAVKRDTLDVFWGPAHRLSPFMPKALPTVLTVHDLTWKHHGQTMTYFRRLGDRVLTKIAVRRADRIVAVSKATAKDIKDTFAKRDADVVYPPALRTLRPASNDVITRLGLGKRPYCLFVGTLEPRKNIERLLEAFLQACEGDHSQNWTLVIVGGNGWRNRSIWRSIEAGVATGRVIVTGYLSEVELDGLYASARFLALPSLLEGFGLPVVEAHQYGVPVLASYAGSLPEVGGDGAIYVDPFDGKGMAKSIRLLFEDDDLHRSLSVAARQNASRFSSERSAEAMLETFNLAIQSRRGLDK